MNIAYVASEIAPYSKTGGLADVAGSLPQHLAGRRANVVLFSPKYGSIPSERWDLFRVPKLTDIALWLGGREYHYTILQKQDKNRSLKTYFVQCDELFDREGMYVNPKTGKDYPDNDIRFAFFARAVLNTLERLEFKPDIIHVNDWQSALIPAYLKTAERDHPFFQDTKTILTIHNVAYQGLFPQESFEKLGINKQFLYPTSPFEFWGKLNYLKAGVVYSDLVNTVSETYAQEIQSSDEFGCGLEGVLKDKRNALFGVVNGVDYGTWSPENDKMIAQPYDVNNLEEKIQNKKELLRYCGLSDIRAEQPLIGIIGRLTDQKGFDLIEEIADDLFKNDITLIQLGTGDKKYKKLFEALEKKYPDRIKSHFAFDERLAHLIEAGADIFLMPSRFEPCGLNQLYSLRYGTIPVAHKTGGLADTIIDYDGNGNKRRATGFLFDEYTGKALLKSIERALELYNKRARSWRAMQKRAMKKDFSWKKSAKKYLELYERALGVQP